MPNRLADNIARGEKDSLAYLSCIAELVCSRYEIDTETARGRGLPINHCSPCMAKAFPKRTQSSNPKVDSYLEREEKWQREMTALRKLALQTGMAEEFKWGHPCYTLNGANVVLIHGFKDYCALLFMKGALMRDTHRVLIQQTENVQAARHLRFQSPSDVRRLSAIIGEYLEEAMAIEQAGLQVVKKKTSEYPVPEEFAATLRTNKKLREAFAQLTPGRQRAYLFYFAQAKQSATRNRRIEQCTPDILALRGLNEVDAKRAS